MNYNVDLPLPQLLFGGREFCMNSTNREELVLVLLSGNHKSLIAGMKLISKMSELFMWLNSQSMIGPDFIFYTHLYL